MNCIKYLGPPIRDIFSELAGETLADKAVDVYRECYNFVGKLEANHYPGMLETLAQLSQDYKLMVATSKRTHFVEDMITYLGFSYFFHAICSSPNTPETKTQLLGRILNDLSQVIMIGDRKFDMIGAKENNVRSIGALWGYGSEEELLQSGVMLLCKELRDLVRLLEVL
ncbi:MAG: HAD-IA family hydrolase [Trueperaceae bacterium]